jgi:enoyl-CoA hydratase/carnithine racemase
LTDSLIADDSTPCVRVITLNRQQRLNVLDGPRHRPLNQAVRDCSAPDRDIRLIVIRDSGCAFCSGSDLKWLASSGVLSDVGAPMRPRIWCSGPTS